jgi:hypothetical protein
LVDPYRIPEMTFDMWVELMCSGSVCSFCSFSDTRRFTHVKPPPISHETGKNNEIVTRTTGTYRRSSQVFCKDQPSYDGDLKSLEVITKPLGTLVNILISNISPSRKS